jgi:exodeoxyribonuclease VII small subunit
MTDDSTDSKPDTASGSDGNLESRLRRLEEIVNQLETEELELDRALALFEEGVAHVKEANKALAAAELRVEELLGDDASTRPLDEGRE